MYQSLQTDIICKRSSGVVVVVVVIVVVVVVIVVVIVVIIVVVDVGNQVDHGVGRSGGWCLIFCGIDFDGHGFFGEYFCYLLMQGMTVFQT